jgi:Cft2 family RNA processing exonuclease
MDNEYQSTAGKTIVVSENGVEVRKGDMRVALDPDKKEPGSLVSHAHMDHLSSVAYMTRETHSILKVRRPRCKGIPCDYNTRYEINGFEVTFYPAGHVFGSAMIKVDDVLYTGDFNTQDGYTCGHAHPMPCRVLVVEATYGTPDHVLPKKSVVYRDMVRMIREEKDQIVIAAYAFGKAQEIISLLNKNDISCAVPDEIAQIAYIYSLHGYPLKYEPLNLKTDAKVAIVPRVLVQKPTPEVKRLLDAGAKTAIASGWAAFQLFNAYDRKIPLSDHADFWDIIKFVEQCSPEKVYTVHGYPRELAREIRDRLGIEAYPLRD